MVGKEEFPENDSDDEINNDSHNKLLSAVSRIYKKQRVDKPKRSEPNFNVSEYHLSNFEGEEADQDKIEIYDLVNTLNKKASHNKIKSKFKSLENRATKLPKPLEKIYADKIKRSVGYEHLSNHVSRWNELVQLNRTAPQLSFPLSQEPEIKVYQPLEFLNTFKEPTELEKNMAEVLQQSTVAGHDSQVEKAIYDLSISEMIQKRKLMAKLKSKESFQIVKAMKQNKIKSKKYRRILRKEKMKEELKDFETLQRTDPEAALEKLNKIERERAEERASLRHRNTGKWARGQAIRAKYDVDARIQLAEQIAKSRELTQKHKLAEESSTEDDDDDDDDGDGGEKDKGAMVWKKSDDDNPWTQEQEQEEQSIGDFIEGYQNYWKLKKNRPDATPKPGINKGALARLVGEGAVKSVKNNDITTDDNETLCVTPDINKSPSIKSFDEKPSSRANLSSKSSPDTPLKTLKQKSPSCIKNDVNSQSQSPEKVRLLTSGLPKNPPVNSKIEINKEFFKPTNSKLIRSPKTESSDAKTKVVLNIEASKGKLDSSPIANKEDIQNGKRKVNSKGNLIIKKKKCIKNVSGKWEVAQNDICSSDRKADKVTNRPKNNIDDIFNEMEDSLQEKVRQRLKKLDDSSINDEEMEGFKSKETAKNDINKIKVGRAHGIQGKKMNETEKVQRGDEDEQLDDLLKIINDGDKSKDIESNKEPAIDPNKFLNVKPRVLNAQIPDLLTEGDDIIDDPEHDRRANISEAFAEDDVIEEFRKEKEEDIKNSENKDIDLFLPGWGSWGGHNVDSSTGSLRKRKRFIVKAPQQKRKDANKPHIIIKEDISDRYKEHLVSDVPYPFSSVRDYEASMRAPIGSTWVPERAVTKLTQPAVVKKMGTVIEPMTDNQLAVSNSKKLKLKLINSNNN